MKFLCPSCKAKYQIADEKVAGRTLRMACRQCKADIVIRGDSVSQGTSAGGIPAPPSRLGADFQRQVAEGAAPSVSVNPPPASDQWHVAINDVPVGPMRRDEVARKISAGAVGPESLAWREGLDDWLPVRHIAELAVLCPPASVAPGGAAAGAVPPPPAAAAATAASAATGGLPPPPAAAVVPPGVSLPPPPPAPAARGAQVPVGGSHGAAVPQAPAPSVLPSAAPAAPVEPAPARRSYAGELDAPVVTGGSNISWAQMFLLVCGGAFILAMGALLGAKMLSSPESPTAAVTPTSPAPEDTPEEAPDAPEPAEPLTREDAVAAEIELDLQEVEGEAQAKVTKSTGKQSPRGSGAGTTGTKTSGKKLTQAERDMLARMGGGSDTAVNSIRATTPRKNSSSGSSSGAGLKAGQLSAVVSKGKRSLQRCYESALRGAGTDDAVRMDISLTVSRAGNVKSVRTKGKGLPGMSTCITRTVKAWRFPKSSGETPFNFPIVFSPGG